MLYKPLGVDVYPEIVLARWRIFEVSSRFWEGRTRHFVGDNLTEGSGRVSSQIVQFDKEKMMGITRSNRAYELRGPSGFDRDGLYVWNRWCEICEAENIVDVTEEYE